MIGDTSVTLKSMNDIDGTSVTMSAYFGSKGFATIEPGNGVYEEQISFSGITQNANGTATLTGVKTVLFSDPYTETSGLAKTHAGSTTLVISNTAGFYNELTSKDNDETVNGLWQFVQFPQMTTSATPTISTQLANKSYVDSVAGGIAITAQIITLGTAGEALTIGQSVYQKVSDGKWYKTDATDATKADGVELGVAQSSVSANASVYIVQHGIDANQSGLTAGTLYYLGNTSGSISSSAGSTSVLLGQARTTTQLYVDQRFTQVPTALEKAQIPTAGEKNALPGNNTTIAVGSTNKYVTQTGLQNGAEVYAVTTGTASNYVITLSPTPTAYAAGQKFNFKASLANTGTATVNVNGLGAKDLLKLGGTASLAANDIVSGEVTEIVYDGTAFQIINSPASLFGITGYASAAVSLGGTGTSVVTISCNANERLFATFTGQIQSAAATSQTLTAVLSCDSNGMMSNPTATVATGSSNAGMAYPTSLSAITNQLAAGTRTVTYTFTQGSSGGSSTGTLYVMKISG